MQRAKPLTAPWPSCSTGSRSGACPPCRAAPAPRARSGKPPHVGSTPRAFRAVGPVNDSSMVIAIEGAGRRILLTGDIEAAAIAGLLSRHPPLRADVLELPHHGA